MVLFLRSRKDAVLFSSYVSQQKSQVTLNLRFALCMSWRSMAKSRMRTQVFRKGMPVAVQFKQAQVFVFLTNRSVNFLVSFYVLIAIILMAYNEQLFLPSALKSVISLCEIVYIGVYGQLKVPPTRLRHLHLIFREHYSLQDTFILCFRHKNLLVLSFLNDLLFFLWNPNFNPQLPSLSISNRKGNNKSISRLLSIPFSFLILVLRETDQYFVFPPTVNIWIVWSFHGVRKYYNEQQQN